MTNPNDQREREAGKHPLASWEFIWKRKLISKYGDLFNVIENTKDKQEVHDFLEIASKHTPWIMHDIKYYLGYKSEIRAKKIWDLWGDANMNAWYRLGLHEGKKGFIGITPWEISKEREE